MATVYLVSSGCYSDYRVRAVFNDREMAEEFVERFSGIDDYDDKMYVEEWKLNPDIPQIRAGLVAFQVKMARDGTTIEARPLEDIERSDYIGAPSACNRDYGRGFMICRHYAKDTKHAVKIANEKRVQLIANGEWE